MRFSFVHHRSPLCIVKLGTKCPVFARLRRDESKKIEETNIHVEFIVNRNDLIRARVRARARVRVRASANHTRHDAMHAHALMNPMRRAWQGKGLREPY